MTSHNRTTVEVFPHNLTRPYIIWNLVTSMILFPTTLLLTLVLSHTGFSFPNTPCGSYLRDTVLVNTCTFNAFLSELCMAYSLHSVQIALYHRHLPWTSNQNSTAVFPHTLSISSVFFVIYFFSFLCIIPLTITWKHIFTISLNQM